MNIVDLMNDLAYGNDPMGRLSRSIQKYQYKSDGSSKMRKKNKLNKSKSNSSSKELKISQLKNQSYLMGSGQNKHYSQNSDKLTFEEEFHKINQSKYDFQAERMNANFISVYDEVEKKFYYYVEKLIGVQIKFLNADEILERD